MKRTLIYSLVSFALTAIILISCDLFGDLIDLSFTTGYEEIPFSVDPSSAGEYTFVEKVLKSDIEAEVNENGGNIADLKDIKINEAKLEMLTPGQNLDAFEWVKVYISAEGHAEMLVAWALQIGNGLVLADLTLTEESLKELLEEEEYVVRVVGYLSEDVTVKLDLMVKAKYKVDVG